MSNVKASNSVWTFPSNRAVQSAYLEIGHTSFFLPLLTALLPLAHTDTRTPSHVVGMPQNTIPSQRKPHLLQYGI